MRFCETASHRRTLKVRDDGSDNNKSVRRFVHSAEMYSGPTGRETESELLLQIVSAICVLKVCPKL